MQNLQGFKRIKSINVFLMFHPYFLLLHAFLFFFFDYSFSHKLFKFRKMAFFNLKTLFSVQNKPQKKTIVIHHKYCLQFLDILPYVSKYNYKYILKQSKQIMTSINNKRNVGIIDSFFNDMTVSKKNQQTTSDKQINKPSPSTLAINTITEQQKINVQPTPKKIVRTNRNAPITKSNQQIQQETSVASLFGNIGNLNKLQIEGQNNKTEEVSADSNIPNGIALAGNIFFKTTTKIIKTIDNPLSFAAIKKDNQRQQNSVKEDSKPKPKFNSMNQKNLLTSKANVQTVTKEVVLPSQLSDRSNGQSNKKIQRRPANIRQIKFTNKKQATELSPIQNIKQDQEQTGQISPVVKEFENTETKKTTFQRTNNGTPKGKSLMNTIINKIQTKEEQTSNIISPPVSILKDNVSTLKTSKASQIKPPVVEKIVIQSKTVEQKPVQNVIKPRMPYSRTYEPKIVKVQAQVTLTKAQLPIPQKNIVPEVINPQNSTSMTSSVTTSYKPRGYRNNQVQEPIPQPQKAPIITPKTNITQSKSNLTESKLTKEPPVVQTQKPIVNTTTTPKGSFRNPYTRNNLNPPPVTINNEPKVEQSKEVSLTTYNSAQLPPSNSRLNKILNKRVQTTVDTHVEDSKSIVQNIKIAQKSEPQRPIIKNSTSSSRFYNNSNQSTSRIVPLNESKAQKAQQTSAKMNILDESKVDKIKQNPPKTKQKLRQQMTQLIQTIKKSIKTKFQTGLSKLRENVRYQKLRKTQSSVLLLQSIKIQKAKQNNLKQSSFQLIKKIFIQKYALQLKTQLNYNPINHKSFIILLMDKLYLNKTRQFFNRQRQKNGFLRSKAALLSSLQNMVSKISNKFKAESFVKINLQGRNRYNLIFRFVNIATNCNKNKLENAFIKILSIPPQQQSKVVGQQLKIMPVAVENNNLKKGRNVVKVEEIVPQQNVQPIKNQKIQKLQKVINTLNNDLKQFQQKSKIKKTKQQKQKQSITDKLNTLKSQNEQLIYEISTKKQKNKDLTTKILTLKSVIQFQPKVQEQNNQKINKLNLLATIYVDNFKNQDDLISSQQIIENYRLRFEDGNALLNQWQSIMKNKQLKKIIGAYENVDTKEYKARRSLLQQQKLVMKLISSYTKQQYFWDWIHQYANNS